MKNRLARHLAASLWVLLPLSAWTDELPPPNNLYLAGDLPNATLLHVETPGLKSRPQLVTLISGKLRDGLRIPEGAERLLSLTATDADGKVLYQGEVALDVNAEFVPQV